MSQHKSCLLVLVWAYVVLKAMGCGLCEEAGQNSFTCPNTENKQFNFSVEVFPKAKIFVQCLQSIEPDYSLLDGCEFTSVTQAVFAGCTLPNRSYKEVLQSIGVNPANIISLNLFNVIQEGNLTQQHLQGLNNLKYLNVTGIHSVTSDALRDASKLEAIKISNSNLTTLAANFFQNLTSLQTVMLQNNKLEELPSTLFNDVPDLETIDLHNNSIPILHEDLFKALKYLKTLNIKNNKLEILSGDLFSENLLLESVDLSGNLLSEMKTETFRNLLRLEMLNLGHNRLSTLPAAAFIHCHSLIKIELNNNFLTYDSLFNTFPEESSLTYIDLSHNNLQITNINYFALAGQTKVQHLFLSNNNINVIPATINNIYTRLKTVDLSRNSFTYLDFTDFIFQSDDVTLNLKHNNIKGVNFSKSYQLYGKEKLNIALEGNPLLCDCNNYGFLRVLQGKSFPRINYTLEIILEDIDESFCQFTDGKLENLMQVQTETLTCTSRSESSDCLYYHRAHDDMKLIDCSYLNLNSIMSLNLTEYSQKKVTLILANNSLTSLHGLQNYVNLVSLTVPFNKLPSLNVSHLPPNLKALDVRGNNLTTLSSVVLHHLNDTDVSLKLGGNPWHCNCDMLDLFRFLHVPSRKVSDFEDLQCKENGEPVMSLSEHDLCPFFMQPMVIVTIVAILVFLILFAVLGTMSFYKYKQGIKVWLYAHHMCLWAITEEELDADKKYDAFISYSHKDEEFVTKVLVPGLECGEPKYRVCLHWRDWVPGEFIQNQIMQSVEASRRTIIVLSSSFIESVWGQLEFLAAHSQALQDRTNRIIIIVYGKIPPEEVLDEKLKLYINTKTYLKWGDRKFWEKLRYIMPHPPDLLQKKQQKCKNMNQLEPRKSMTNQSKC